MKNKLITFAAGMLTALTLTAVTLPTLASDGALALTAYPVSIEVNGQAFVPKDANGKAVDVFTVNGTTYVPLRAIAETLGFEASYDSGKNLVSINAPAAGTGDFTSQWELKEKPVTNYGSERIFTAKYSGDMTMDEFKVWWKSLTEEEIEAGACEIAAQAQSTVPGCEAKVYFTYGTYNLGSSRAAGEFRVCNFDAAGAWIK